MPTSPLSPPVSHQAYATAAPSMHGTRSLACKAVWRHPYPRLTKGSLTLQTGNAITLALGASNQPITQPYSWLKSLVAIILYMSGCYFFAQSRRIHPHRRLILAASFVLQALLIFVAAAIVQRNIVPSPSGYHQVDPADVQFIELLPIGFLAFQSGGQIAASRILKLDEVPTIVLTSLFCDLIIDPHLLAKENPKRNRRIASAITLFIGGITGGWLSRSSVGMSAALWLAGAVKIAIALVWLLWKAKTEVLV